MLRFWILYFKFSCFSLIKIKLRNKFWCALLFKISAFSLDFPNKICKRVSIKQSYCSMYIFQSCIIIKLHFQTKLPGPIKMSQTQGSEVYKTCSINDLLLYTLWCSSWKNNLKCFNLDLFSMYKYFLVMINNILGFL